MTELNIAPYKQVFGRKPFEVRKGEEFISKMKEFLFPDPSGLKRLYPKDVQGMQSLSPANKPGTEIKFGYHSVVYHDPENPRMVIFYCFPDTVDPRKKSPRD